MKIDSYSHIMPPKYEEVLRNKQPQNLFISKYIAGFPSLTDLDLRFRIMDKYDGLMQVLALEASESWGRLKPQDKVELARIANDEMAELVFKHPDRFVAAIASLPMSDIDAALKEVDRAIADLRFRGVQVFTDVDGKPLDSPEFMPLYEKMAYYDLPIFIHPQRARTVPDYPVESESKYLVSRIFGWPYETTVAMARLVFSGILEKFANLKVMIHHCGAMVPYLADRIAAQTEHAEMRMGYRYEANLTRHPLGYFRMFYTDTALYGNTPALMCGYSFFGGDHLLFGTDMPYDSQLGDRATRQVINAIEQMDIPEAGKKKVFENNVRKLMRLPV